MPQCSGHVRVECPTLDAYRRALSFYTCALGFRLLEQRPWPSERDPRALECWLHWFSPHVAAIDGPSSAPQSPIMQGANGIASSIQDPALHTQEVTVQLNYHSKSECMSKQEVDALRQALSIERFLVDARVDWAWVRGDNNMVDGASATTPFTLGFCVPSATIDVTARHLHAIGYPADRRDSTQGYNDIELWTRDPLGNGIYYTSAPPPPGSSRIQRTLQKYAVSPVVSPVYHQPGNGFPQFALATSPEMAPMAGGHFRRSSALGFAGVDETPATPASLLALAENGPAVEPPVHVAPPVVHTKKLAILTSGGDAPGMNAAVRAAVRVAILKGCEPWAVLEGYQGLVEGGKKMKRMHWDDVQGILGQGGTIIGTARSADFRKREGRLAAARNLVQRGIDALVVIGGDGSLTGADLLRSEWSGLVEELRKSGVISEVEAGRSQHLTIVGMVGSIDNDMASTDITIGAVSSLHRICEAVDCISATAMSHQRAFVIEVMGRNCGWLALMAGISTGADYLFIPEKPPRAGWEERMCTTISKHREMGKRKSIIIVAEGAIDEELKPIRADYLKELIAGRLGVDTRVTTLGHVQRGGAPAAYDRYLGTVQGVAAVKAVLEATPESEPPLIGMSANQVTYGPLMKAVEATRAVSDAIKSKNFDKAFALRDPEFRSSYVAFRASASHRPPENVDERKSLRIAIVHVGAPAGGMNAATRAAVRYALNRGHVPLLINNGFAGLMQGDVRTVQWMDVENWTTEGGSNIGTNRSQPSEDLGLIAYQLQKHGVQALVVMGGFEAFTTIQQLMDARQRYPAFCIPLVAIPATISNNVPGSEFSLGSDTSLNVIIEACDRIRQSAYSSRKRVFVVEVQGGHCGYLATMAALSAGCTCSYIPEEGINLQQIAGDCALLIRKFREGANQGRVIIRNETVSDTYTTDVISSIFREEGRGIFDARSSILGHIQQGGAPSPLDRVRALRVAVKCIDWIEEKAFAVMEQSEKHASADPHTIISGGIYTNTPDTAVVLGIQGADNVTTSVADLLPQTDIKKRTAKNQWWLGLNQLVRTLARHGFALGRPLAEGIDGK